MQDTETDCEFARVSNYFGETEFMLHFGRGFHTDRSDNSENTKSEHLYTAEVASTSIKFIKINYRLMEKIIHDENVVEGLMN